MARKAGMPNTKPYILCLAALALVVAGCSHLTQEPNLTSPHPSAVERERAPEGMVSSEFIFQTPPTPSCHASTIVATSDGLVAAWFGGSSESASDVGIWLSRKTAGGQWSEPERVASGRTTDGQPCACWNPVLFQSPRGPLLLFYKVGADEPLWWGEVKQSSDNGHTWSGARRLPDGILGPIKNKPVTLADGTILSPSSKEVYLRLPNALADLWQAHVEISSDGGFTWSKIGPLSDPLGANVIQPTVLVHGADDVQLLLRAQSGAIQEAWSSDRGRTWSVVTPTELPNPDAGIDAVILRDGRALLVYNHTRKGRHVLNVALSADGRHWSAALELENHRGEFSYPAVIQTTDGLVHVTYTWHRKRIKHVVLDPAALSLRPIVAGQWPAGMPR